MTTEIPEIFRTVLELPFPLLNFDDDESEKEKLALGGSADLGGGGSDMGPSAALTPAIWEKTIPYDGESFHLEYMDLEEFLMENGIPTSAGDDASKDGSEGSAVKTEKDMAEKMASLVSLVPTQELDKCEEEEEEEEEEEVVIITKTESDSTCDVDTEVTTSKDRVTPEPVGPEEVEVDVNYEPDPTDLILSSVPGGELFDPRKHRFSEEELKPQPMIKKAKKVLVPEDQKDEKYWQRRKKNNLAAKRSRDARRLKENQITVRAAFLERENATLRTEVGDLRKECSRYKITVSRYEDRFGPL